MKQKKYKQKNKEKLLLFKNKIKNRGLKKKNSKNHGICQLIKQRSL